jgi:hypothetical protein
MNDFQQIIHERISDIESSNLHDHVKKVVNKVTYCRTNAMPGRVYSCPKGHMSVFIRESCNNRSCPTCQHEKKEEWKEKTKDLVLKSPHYHIVFKLPTFCYPYVTKYYKEFIGILFKSSSKTIEKILKYSKYEQSSPGVISILHTHGDEYQVHPHIHMLLSGVGYDKDDEKIVYMSESLFNLEDFQSIYLSILKKELHELHKKKPEIGELFHKQIIGMREQKIFLSKRYDSAEYVIEYLSRTIKGNGISLNELELVAEDRIEIQKKGNSCSLEINEFIRRYMLHILPPNTKSVRYMGLYSSSNRENLKKAKILLKREQDSNILTENIEIEEETEIVEEKHPIHKFCPICKSRMELVEEVDEYEIPRIIRLKFGKDPPVEDLFKRLVA